MMKLLIFTEGTIIMHKGGLDHSRTEIVSQVEKGEPSIHDFGSYIPIGHAVAKLLTWKQQGALIHYLTSRRKPTEIAQIQNVLYAYQFPEGQLLYRNADEEYKDVAKTLFPDILIEDDCESIGGANNMTITNVEPTIRAKIHSIPVQEFGGIDHLPNDLSTLRKM